MSDRHVRRNGDDYGDAFLNLLPQGQAWPKYPGTTLDLACRGLSNYWGYVDDRAADLLETESDPRLTTADQLLPDWERNWGLPDPCYDSKRSRNAELVERMTLAGAQSREFFIQVAASLGYSITITEYRVWVVGIDRCGDSRVYGEAPLPMYNEHGNPILDTRGNPVAEGELSEWPHYGLGPPENRFYWTVHVDDAVLIWFRVGEGGGECGVDPHLYIGTFDDLECLLNRWKPAHTEIIFDYSSLYDPPTAVLSNNTVTEVAYVGTEIGVFDIVNAYAGSPKYFLTNDAGGQFRIVGNKLLLAKPLDFEIAPSYEIEVMVSDVQPVMGLFKFTITVIDIDETLPIITSPPTWLVPENEKLAFPLTANKAVTWSISGGADAAKFELYSTAEGSFLRWAGDGTKDFESPDDVGLNNSYVIQVRVDDLALNVAHHTITFNVFNVEDKSGAMVMGAFINEGNRRQAYVDGIMINMR